MSCWITVPSIRPDGGTLREWQRAGYKVAVMRQGDELDYPEYQILVSEYQGWAKSINRLIRDVMAMDLSALWFVAAGDDTLPAASHPLDIADEMESYCWKVNKCEGDSETFGVMQPTGDLKDWPASRIDKFAGSAFIGREFARRMYGGKGPLFEYPHCFADEELMAVATKMGVFWQRPDLTHKHLHQMRPGGMPLALGVWEATAGADYIKSRPLFEQRKTAGWPGHEPIP